MSSSTSMPHPKKASPTELPREKSAYCFGTASAFRPTTKGMILFGNPFSGWERGFLGVPNAETPSGDLDCAQSRRANIYGACNLAHVVILGYLGYDLDSKYLSLLCKICVMLVYIENNKVPYMRNKAWMREERETDGRQREILYTTWAVESDFDHSKR